MDKSNKINNIHRLRVVNFNVSTELLRKSSIGVNNSAEKRTSDTKYNNSETGEQNQSKVVDENRDIKSNLNGDNQDVNESYKSSPCNETQKPMEALPKELQKPVVVLTEHEQHVRLENDTKDLNNSKNDSKGLLDLPTKRRVKRKRIRYKKFNFDGLKRSLSHHSHQYSNQIRDTVTSLRQGNNSLFRSHRKRRHGKDDTSRRKCKDDVKILFNRETSQVKSKGEVKSSRSLEDVFGFRRSNRFSSPYVYQQHCKPRRVKIDRPCKSCTPIQILMAVQSNLKHSKSVDSHKVPKHQPLHVIKFPQGSSRSSIKLPRKSRVCSLPFLSKKIDLCPSRMAITQYCGDAAVGDHTSIANAAVSAEKPFCIANNITRKNPNVRKKHAVQTCIKYLLFGLIAIVWAPCILLVLLCWVITYPLRPQAIINRYCGECKGPPKQHGFLSWIKSADWYNRNVFEAVGSVLKGTKSTKKHPDPNKEYTLYHSCERGWVIKPKHGNKPTFKNRSWTTNQVQDTSLNDAYCHGLRAVQIPPERKNWCGTCPISDFERSMSCPTRLIGKQTKDGDIKIPLDRQPRRRDEKLKRSTLPGTKDASCECFQPQKIKEPLKEIYKAPQKRKKEKQKAPDKPNKHTSKRDTEEPPVCECTPGQKRGKTATGPIDLKGKKKTKKRTDSKEALKMKAKTPQESKSKKISKEQTKSSSRREKRKSVEKKKAKGKGKSRSPGFKLKTVPVKRKKSKFSIKQCLQQFVNLDKAVWAEKMDCNNLYIHTMKNRPCFCIYRCCPSFYPRFIKFYKCYLVCCHCFLLCLSTIVWFPAILCCYLCITVLCNICK